MDAKQCRDHELTAQTLSLTVKLWELAGLLFVSQFHNEGRYYIVAKHRWNCDRRAKQKPRLESNLLAC